MSIGQLDKDGRVDLPKGQVGVKPIARRKDRMMAGGEGKMSFVRSSQKISPRPWSDEKRIVRAVAQAHMLLGAAGPK